MSQRCFNISFALIFTFLTALTTISAHAGISVHKTDFFMLSKDDEIFYPYGVNVDFLMKPERTNDEVGDFIANLAGKGVNTIRLNTDASHTPNAPLSSYQEQDGRLKEPVIDRLDAIFDVAGKHGIYVALGIFDLQSIGENWAVSPYNRSNGGDFETLNDFFTSPDQLLRSMERAAQLVSRFKNKNVFAWELGRGSNVWELNKRPNYKLMKGVALWTVRMANRIRKEDQTNLIALSTLPNTVPESLFNLPQIDLFFIDIHASDTILTVESVPQYIQMIRKQFKKPIIVAENAWKGEPRQRELFTRNLFWTSFASISSSFLMPMEIDKQFRFADNELNLFKTLQYVMPDIDLSGPPREIAAPQQTLPKDTYLLVESLVGYDRIYWITRKVPGESNVQLDAMTIEGVYEKQWFDIEKGVKYTRGKFWLKRKQLLQESPPFERDILGVLRLAKRAPETAKKSESNKPADKQ